MTRRTGPALTVAASSQHGHLLRLVRAYARYYNEDRPHMSLNGNAPVPRALEAAHEGEVIALPRVGGLHHRYVRRAAA